MAKAALGRGLGALLGGVSPAVRPDSPASTAPAPPASQAPAGEEVVRVDLSQIVPCPFQPRKDFSAESLQELADSIKEQGIIQPLIVRFREGHFELIAGERRWRAAQMAGLAEAPVLVREADDASVLEMALIENLQRENLNPIEEALGYSQLLEQFHLKQEEVAVKVGKNRATVANALRLLKLPPQVQEHVRHGRISAGHAKVILGLAQSSDQHMAAEKILSQGLSVRQTEEMIAAWHSTSQTRNGTASAPGGAPGTRDTHVMDLEHRLKQRLGTKVSIRYREGKGSLDIRFYSDEELDRVLNLLGVVMD
jgi:ParB family transcriptional regulator, chromosome partitioning protein